MIERGGLGIACALGAAALYGFVPNLVGVGIKHGVPAVEATFFRTSLIAVALAIAGILQSQSFRIPRAAVPSFVAQSFATALISVSYLAAVQFIPVSLSVIIFFSFPVIILLAAPVIEGQKPRHRPHCDRPCRIRRPRHRRRPELPGDRCPRPRARGAVVGGRGPAILLRPRALALSAGRGSRKPRPFRHLAPHTDRRPLVRGRRDQFLPRRQQRIPPATQRSGVSASIYVIAYFFQMSSLRYAPASSVAPFYNLEPVVTTAVAATLLGERWRLNQYPGGGIVLAALVASSLYGRRKDRQS